MSRLPPLRRGWRFIAQIVLLIGFTVLAYVSSDALQFVLIFSVLISWPISVAVAVVLILLANQDDDEPPIETLIETADNAVTLALANTAVALVCLALFLRILRIIDFSIGILALVGLGYAVVLIGVPALSWSRTLRVVWVPMLRERLARKRDKRTG